MNRARLYNDFIDAVKGQLPEIKHVDLWNRNIEFIEQEDWFMPAVFLEFGEIFWSASKVDKDTIDYKGKGTLTIHIVTPWDGSASADSPARNLLLRYFDLSARIQKIMELMEGEDYGGIWLNSTKTNHDHADIVENIDIYVVTFHRRVSRIQTSPGDES